MFNLVTASLKEKPLLVFYAENIIYLHAQKLLPLWGGREGLLYHRRAITQLHAWLHERKRSVRIFGGKYHPFAVDAAEFAGREIGDEKHLLAQLIHNPQGESMVIALWTAVSKNKNIEIR